MKTLYLSIIGIAILGTVISGILFGNMPPKPNCQEGMLPNGTCAGPTMITGQTYGLSENNCGQFYTIPQDSYPNGSETYPVLILKQNSIGCAKLTYTINYNYNDNRSGSVWSQMLNFTDMFHIGKYNYTSHGNSFGVSSIDTMQMFKTKSIPEVVDLAKYPVGSQFTVILVIQPLPNATGFYDYSIEEIPCGSYPLAVGYSPDQVNSSDFSKGMVTMHNHSCLNEPYLISSVQVSGMDFKQIKFP